MSFVRAFGVTIAIAAVLGLFVLCFLALTNGF